MANIYKKRGKSEQTNKEGGYKNVVLFAPVDTFLTMGVPTNAPAVAGDKVSISDDHTFGAEDGFISLLSKKHSVTTTSESTGDDGAKSLVHKAKFVLLGDDASTLEQMRDMLNDDIVWLVKDQDCANTDTFIQLGDGCLQPTATISFDGKTTAEGLKEYTVELSVKDKKFFYSGTVTQKPVE